MITSLKFMKPSRQRNTLLLSWSSVQEVICLIMSEREEDSRSHMLKRYSNRLLMVSSIFIRSILATETSSWITSCLTARVLSRLQTLVSASSVYLEPRWKSSAEHLHILLPRSSKTRTDTALASTCGAQELFCLPCFTVQFHSKLRAWMSFIVLY